MKHSPMKIVTGEPYVVLVTEVFWAFDLHSCIGTAPELDWDLSLGMGDRIVIDGDWRGREAALVVVRRKSNRDWEEVPRED